MASGAPTLGGLNRLQNPRFKNITVTTNASVGGDLTVTGTLTAGSIGSGGDIVLGNGESIKTDTTTAHTATLQAYDVNGAAYKDFLTLTNGDTPSMAIAAPSGGTVSIDGSVIGGTTPLAGTFTTLASTGLATLASAAVTGNATVSGYNLRSVGNALTAAGNDRATALQLAKEINNITTAAASTGVILPVGVAGMRITVFNGGANAVQVYASASETIDGVAGATGVPLTNAKRADFFFVAADTWVSAQLGVVSA